jgi:hypothetical protein
MLKEKRTIRYWIKWASKNPKDILYSLEEIKYILKYKHHPRCLLGFHKAVSSTTWYYEPDWYCAICDEQDVFPVLDRYASWSSVHTMNPFAWPWVLYASIRYWWEDRNNSAQKD